MIRRKRTNYGLSNYLNTIPFLDTTEDAEFTFQVYNFPSVFYLGKNAFTILGNSEYLTDNSDIIIDIEDKDGNAIYYEITNIINKDRTRTISVYIYPDTSIGYCTVYIGGTLKKNFLSNQPISSNSINVLWSKRVLVTTSDIVKSQPLFSIPPVIKFSEKRVPRKILQISRKSEQANRGFGRISGKSIFTANNLNPTYLDRDVDLDANVFYPIITTQNGEGITNGPVNIPSTGFTRLTTNFYTFSSSMEGGEIVIRDITASGVPRNTSETFLPPEYSASILRVINESTIEVFPPWTYTKQYYDFDGNLQEKTFDSFFNSQIFTASFLGSDAFVSAYTESYLRLEYSKINPDVGYIDSIKLSFKDSAAFGSKVILGSFKITPQNLLSDPAEIVYTNGEYTERPIGQFYSTDVTKFQYWSSSLHGVSSASYDHIGTSIINGLLITHTGIPSSSNYISIQPRNEYSVPCYENSEYELGLTVCPIQSSGSIPQLDIYISGSNIELPEYTETIRTKLEEINSVLDPIDINAINIGTVRTNSSSPKEISFKFRTKSDSQITPIFLLRSGQWNIGNIYVRPLNSRGYNNTSGVLYAPLSQEIYSSEPIVEVEYLNHEGISSNIVAKISGLPVIGSDSNVTLSRISGDHLRFDINKNVFLHIEDTLKHPPPAAGMVYSTFWGESSTMMFLTQSITSASLFSTAIQRINIPIFRDIISGSQESGTKNVNSYAIEMETTILGKTGSWSNILDAYSWAMTYQVRAITSKVDNSSQPFLYTPIIASGSGERLIGTYGGPPSGKPNLDSWVKYFNSITDGENIQLQVQIQPSSSFLWDFYLTTSCKVIKFAKRI